jgi:myo-inositol-1(or 4)-monophosphatase
MKELEIARKAAAAGGEILAGYFRQGIAMRLKQACDLVSDADVESEKAIVAIIQEAFPEDAILGEEEAKGDVSAERLWIVDPLDGTTNFAHDLPHFAVSIGFYEHGQASCGIIFNPVCDDWFHAVRGEGAFHNGERVFVADHSSFDQTLVGCGFYYDRGAMMEATLASIREFFGQQIHGIRRFGTASLDLAQVGCGQFGAFFEYELSPWDFAAGRLFVEEAGGRITTCRGEDLPLAKTSVLASNGLLHEAALQIVARNHPL